MIGLILTGHGQYASGLKSGLNLVVGDLDNVRAIDFEGDRVDAYKVKLKEIISEMLEKYDSLAIATDIAGGTPYNTAVTLTNEDQRVMVFSGLNFQLAYELSNLESNVKSYADEAIRVAKDGVSYFVMNNDNEDTSFEGGI
ncbi:PTS sugar transporter subunit IIA domain-containing protein [Anaerococcus provencensis]|uniref:PTS sugar transporter subunit IIA domain-containing protein n=1 Tax=Anaerococcus provencensis TaxID=938293 RepID=UPI000310AFD7|nr:hypothetical protein [Anaerococcus provencensis]